jgi:hypothetical protein
VDAVAEEETEETEAEVLAASEEAAPEAEEPAETIEGTPNVRRWASKHNKNRFRRCTSAGEAIYR